MEMEIKTNRLTITEIAQRDIMRIRELNNNNATDKHLASIPEEDRAVAFRDSEAVSKLCERFDSSIETEDDDFYGAWKGDLLIGFIVVNADSDISELQIEIDPEFHHLGYGYEFLSALLKHLFENEDYTFIRYSVLPTNIASIALVEKIGGVLQPPESYIEELLVRTYHISKLSMATCETHNSNIESVETVS